MSLGADVRTPCVTIRGTGRHTDLTWRSREGLTIATILVVDDDDDVRELIGLALAGQGHDVESVGSGEAALERLVQHAYDLVVCDLSMAGLDGRAVHRTIDQRPPPRPVVVFITGYADTGPYEEFLRTTRAPVVRKPFDIAVLRTTVHRILSGP